MGIRERRNAAACNWPGLHHTRLGSWEARPLSPLLSWETAGEAPPLPPHAWLESLDLQAEGLAALQDPVERAAGTAAGLDRVHDVLRQHAGGLQALFLLHAADTVAPPEALGLSLIHIVPRQRIERGRTGGGAEREKKK